MAVRTLPSLDSARKAWKNAAAEDAFWHKHYKKLLHDHPDQFVAVSDGKVVATNTDLRQLVRILKEKGLEIPKVWVRFLTADPRRLLL